MNDGMPPVSLTIADASGNRPSDSSSEHDAFSWLPDGSHIIYATVNAITLIDRAGTETEAF